MLPRQIGRAELQQGQQARLGRRRHREQCNEIALRIGLGPSGEGFIRMTLTVPEERIREAVERIGKLGIG